MLHHIDMDDSDGEEDMLLEREERDSDEMEDDEDLSAEYNNYFRQRIGKEKDHYKHMRKRLAESGFTFSSSPFLRASNNSSLQGKPLHQK